ncbi:MAG TPA: hypothetical protein PLB11_07360, partial [Flavobacterium sp.]|nr:hypothetical protein [Flavobacterium sp.]
GKDWNCIEICNSFYIIQNCPKSSINSECEKPTQDLKSRVGFLFMIFNQKSIPTYNLSIKSKLSHFQISFFSIYNRIFAAFLQTIRLHFYQTTTTTTPIK